MKKEEQAGLIFTLIMLFAIVLLIISTIIGVSENISILLFSIIIFDIGLYIFNHIKKEGMSKSARKSINKLIAIAVIISIGIMGFFIFVILIDLFL